MDYDQLVATVRDYWTDKSRTAEEAVSDLRGLVDEIELMLESAPKPN